MSAGQPTPWLPLTAGPVLDLSFLIDHVMMDIKPLHWGDVICSDVPLKVGGDKLQLLPCDVLNAPFG